MGRSMFIEYLTESAAQDKADAIHQWMIANAPAYKASVDAGQTLRWDIAHRERDSFGNIVPGNWRVTVKTKVDGALSGAEKLLVRDK
jgi:hypothetical protein